MTTNIIPPDDDIQIRCPRLGHQISFSYCMNENNDLPCHKSLDCWYNYFPVSEFFEQKLDQDAWERAFTHQTRPKMLSILELIETAKKTAKE